MKNMNSYQRLKYVSTINDESLPEDTDPDYELNYIDIGNVNSQGEILTVAEYKFSDAPSRARRIVQKGDVIVSTVRTYLKAITSIDTDCSDLIVSTGFAVIRPKEKLLNQRYCKYAILDERFIDEIQKRSVGVSYPAINASDIGDIKLPIPSLTQQNKIVAYLEREVAKIDTLIEKKARLVELLEEKKKATISRAVTKGLNPKVKLKPSSIDWLGDIPEHWEVVRLKYFININYGLSQPPEYIDSGTPLIRATNVFRGEISDKDMVFIDTNTLETNKKVLLKKGDIIIVRSGAYTADSAIITEKYENSVAGFDMVIRTKSYLDSEFLAKVLLSDYMLIKQLIPMRVRAAQPHLNAEEVGSTIIVLPTIEEQKDIVRYLKDSLEYLVELERKISNSIDLLKEKRTAIISAAINGEINL